MLTYAVVVFALAAVGGIFLAALHFQGKPLPMPVAIIHGVAAAIGLVLLILYVLGAGGFGLAGTALVILVVAALGGFYLFSFTIKDRPLPSPVVVIHAVAAVAGVGILLKILLG
ncbi:MAG: hypothetical protein AAF657_06160 [Acidobacteriota bacterium]